MLKRKSECQMLLGIGVCCLISCFFMICYILINHHTKEIDISLFSELSTSKNRYFDVEKIASLDDGTYYVVAVSRNKDLSYDYRNWVIGEGKGEYRKVTVLLVDDEEQKAYQLKTYPYAFTPETARHNEQECEKYGVIAYGTEEMFEDGNRRLAVSYEDRAGNSYIIYAGERYEK